MAVSYWGAATTALKLTEDRFEDDDNADDSDYDSDFDFLVLTI